VTDVGHVGAVDDLAVIRGLGVDVDDGDEVRAVDPGALVQRGDVDHLLRRLLPCDLGRRIARSGVRGMIVFAHQRIPSCRGLLATGAAGAPGGSKRRMRRLSPLYRSTAPPVALFY